jgi:ribosomal protein L12E/L44/L45/RPP1/RPP2
MVAQVPELVETLTGKSVGDLLGQLQGVRPPAAPAAAPANGKPKAGEEQRSV